MAGIDEAAREVMSDDFDAEKADSKDQRVEGAVVR